MAAEAEEPLAASADPSPPPPPLLRRASPDDGREEEKGLRERKRRRTCVAALESLETEKQDSLDSFSFEARSIAPIETTPKFGSFNPVLSMETTVIESATQPPPPPPPDKVSDGPPVEAGSGAEGEVEEEGASHSKNGNSKCSEAE